MGELERWRKTRNRVVSWGGKKPNTRLLWSGGENLVRKHEMGVEKFLFGMEKSLMGMERLGFWRNV